MEILKKISDLKKKITQTEQLVDDLLLSLEAKQNNIDKKDQIIQNLKDQIKINLNKIDKIIEDYNANS